MAPTSTPRRFPLRRDFDAGAPLTSLGRRHDDEAMPAQGPARRLVLSCLDDELMHGRCPTHRRAGLRQHLGQAGPPSAN